MEYSQDFERDFMRRTLELVRGYNGEYDATNLLNCLLGLLIVPKQTSLDKIPDDPVEYLALWGISPVSIKDFGRHPKTKRENPKTLREIVHRLRNAVAHFRFSPKHNNGRCTGFEFHDANEFRAEISVKELRVFVEKLAEHLERGASGQNGHSS